jgi:hypothetical protein
MLESHGGSNNARTATNRLTGNNAFIDGYYSNFIAVAR